MATEEVQQEDAMEEEVKNAIYMLEEGTTDSDQAKTRASEILGNLENNIEELEENDAGGEETRNEELEIL